MDRHKHSLVNYLTALTRNRDRAEELAQETFVRLFRGASRYQERGRFQPYLFRVATNLVRSEERRHRRWIAVEALISQDGGRAVASPQSDLLRAEATERVKLALGELPMRLRAPLILREIEGWPYKDIAASLGCREGTVKSRINRGRAQLRRLLEPYWNGGLACPE